MKLGIFLLVFGLVLAGVGAAIWQFGEGQTSTFGILGSNLSYQENDMIRAGGLGVLVIGGGLAIGGIVRMIVKR
jgi:hypothetical protein